MTFSIEGLPRRVNAAGVQLVKDFEDLRLVAYRCPSGVWTIGWGHTRGVYPGMVITLEEAKALLDEDMREAAGAVQSLVRVPLTDNQFSALASFVFNLGAGALKQSSLLKLLNKGWGWYWQVPIQLKRWDKADGKVLNGLTRRRAAEAALWRKM